MTAVFTSTSGVPDDLAFGVFARGASFDAVLRFSNGRQTDDRKSDAHGVAIKLLDVTGDKLLQGREKETTQDFVLVDNETFFTGDPDEYALINRGLLDPRAGLLKRIGFWLGMIFLRLPLLLRIASFAGKKPRSPLASIYFSTTPYSLGGRVVKYVLRPVSIPSGMPALSGKDGLADALRVHLANGSHAFDLGVDVQTNPLTQPIDDPTVAWSKRGARREWLARITINQQDVAANDHLAEVLSFSPWHSLPAHAPRGYINAARKPVYREMQRLRRTLNDVEPKESSELP